MDLKKLLTFVAFTQQFRSIERAVVMLNPARKENDMEHSYQLALVGWYIVNAQKLSLDINKIIQYSLVHDVVEVYAGDTPMNSKDSAYIASKIEREKAAEQKIQETFSEFSELITMLHAYEKREDTESQFVYALDKILPPLNIYLEKGHSWKVNNITLKELIESKKDKVALSLEIKKIFDELVEILHKEEADLF